MLEPRASANHRLSSLPSFIVAVSHHRSHLCSLPVPSNVPFSSSCPPSLSPNSPLTSPKIITQPTTLPCCPQSFSAMKLTVILAALSVASHVQGSASPLLAGPVPYSSSISGAQQAYDGGSSASSALGNVLDNVVGNLGYTVNKALGKSNKSPNIFIVEFDDSAPITLDNGKRDAVDHHKTFHQHMKRAKNKATKKAPTYKTRYEWKDAQLFKGLSVRLDDPEDVAFLKSAPGVKAVSPARYYTSPAFKAAGASKDYALASAEGQSTAGSLASRGMRNDTFSPHVMTGVDKLHALGHFGSGITVGVLDTGIDYTHPALNSGKPAGTACFGAGCQISGGYDFVGDNYNPDNDYELEPDADPFANCKGSGHGTHVSGTIIARQSATNTFTG